MENSVLELLGNLDAFLLVLKSARGDDLGYARHSRDYIRHRAHIRYLALKAKAQDFAELEKCLDKLENDLLDLDSEHHKGNFNQIQAFGKTFESLRNGILANLKNTTKGCPK